MVRAYSSKGKVYNLAGDTSGIAYAAAGNWIFAVNQAGYLKWDILLDQDVNRPLLVLMGTINWFLPV